MMTLREICKLIVLFCAGFAPAACVSFPDAPPALVAPSIDGARLRVVDGAALGLAVWRSEETRAVIIALHGMNDYSNAFAGPGAWWAAEAGITTYAYDQRGFGRSPRFGRWAGADAMVADLRAAVAAARLAHPHVPVYVLGHSMGAAVVMLAEAKAPLDADGLILAAPGVWGGKALPLPYRVSLNIAASLAPSKTLTGERAERQSTDNIDLLRQMFADPLIIKETRLDAILGVVRLMGAAYGAADEIDANILFMIGDKDEIIPTKKMAKAAAKLNGDVVMRRYPQGWHLLFRDLQAETVWRDVVTWIDHKAAYADAAGRDVQGPLRNNAAERP